MTQKEKTEKQLFLDDCLNIKMILSYDHAVKNVNMSDQLKEFLLKTKFGSYVDEIKATKKNGKKYETLCNSRYITVGLF